MYQVGDKVRIANKRGPHWNDEGKMDKWMGKIMTIRDINDMFYRMEEDKDEHLGGWYWLEEDFAEHFPRQSSRKIVITTDGRTTLARLYDGKTVISRAEARCHPQDAFDFSIGAKLAFERLMGKVKNNGVHI